MNTETETILESLRSQAASLNRYNLARNGARDEAIRQLEIATDRAGWGKPPMNSEMRALLERFREVENEADKFCEDQIKLIGLAKEVIKLREDKRLLTEQLAEMNDFRAKLRAFMPAA